MMDPQAMALESMLHAFANAACIAAALALGTVSIVAIIAAFTRSRH